MLTSSRRHLAPVTLLVVLALSLPVVLLVALASGTVALSPQEVLYGLVSGGSESSQSAVIVLDIRLPRILLALLVGGILAATGAVMQGLFRNPLADPSLIGVSSGASAGASLAIVTASPWLAVSAETGLTLVATGAFCGGVAAALLVYRLATSEIGTSVATMLLAGIAISALAGAFNSLLSYFAGNDMLRQISLWQMGHFANASGPRLALITGVAVLLALLLPGDSRALNAMLLGESEARYLGVDVQKVKRRLIVLTALGVGVSVAVVGLVAFVGLVVPHGVRLLIGPDHRWLLPASALGGGLLLVVADTLARVVLSPVELPTGILTALLGAPFFIALLAGQRRSL